MTCTLFHLTEEGWQRLQAEDFFRQDEESLRSSRNDRRKEKSLH